MSNSRFYSDDVQGCMWALSKAKTPSDAIAAWTLLQGRYPEFSALVSLDDYPRDSLPPSIRKYTKPPHSCLAPYFKSNNIYFLEDELLKKTLINGKVDFEVDYTLMFDTNLASFINKLIRMEPLVKNQPEKQHEIVSLFDQLLKDDLNFDHLFYMLENAKQVKTIIQKTELSPLQFWKKLNKKFRNNIVSLQLFRTIDCKEYKRTLNAKPRYSYLQAFREAVTFTNNFYRKEGGYYIRGFLNVQKSILLLLIGMFSIHFSSRKSTKNKTKELFRFTHETMGFFMEKEFLIAHKYLQNPSELKIFRKISNNKKMLKSKKTKNLLKRLDNIAWDIAAQRFMEELLSANVDGRHLIPMMLSFDEGLREIINHTPTKATLLDRKTNIIHPIPDASTEDYFKSNGCGDTFDYYFSKEKVSERLSKTKPTEKETYFKILNSYRKLRKIMNLD